MSIVRVALTGGIACGKSHASQFMKNLGISVIDLDIISQNILRKPQVIHQLQTLFGNQIMDDKQLNKIKLRQLVFDDVVKLKQLEDLLHPSVIKQMQKDISIINSNLVIIAVPLLLEKHLFQHFDKAVVILCSEEVQRQRLLGREYMNSDLADKILNNQSTNAQKEKIANYLPTIFIQNNSRIIDFERQLEDLQL